MTSPQAEPQSFAGQPIVWGTPIPLTWSTLTVSAEAIDWATWTRDDCGQPVPWRLTWTPPGRQPASSRWHLWRDAEGMHLLLRIQTDVRWDSRLTLLTVMLDAARSHRSFHATALRGDGEPRFERRRATRGICHWDHIVQARRARAMPHVRTCRLDDCFWCAVSYRFSDFPSLVHAPNVGLNVVWRAQHHDGAIERLMLGGDGGRDESPWLFADVRMRADTPCVRGMTFHDRNYDANRVSLNVSAPHGLAGPYALVAEVTSVGRNLSSHTAFDAGEDAFVQPMVIVHPDPMRRANQMLSLRIERAGRCVWRGGVRMGHGLSFRQGGHLLHLRHEAPPDKLPLREPAAESTARMRILRKLPHFRREPARVMFTERIICRDWNWEVDLRRPDALHAIGEAFAQRFEAEHERLAALTWFVHQVTEYSSAASAAGTHMDARSQLRLGAALCGDQVCILKAIVETILDPRTGQPYRAHYYNTGNNHVVLAVWLTPDDPVLLDPSYGRVPLHPHENRILTVSEMAADPQLLSATAADCADDLARPDRAMVLFMQPPLHPGADSLSHGCALPHISAGYNLGHDADDQG